MSSTKTGTAVFAFALLSTIILTLALLVGPAAAQKSNPEAEARQELNKVFDALTTGDPEKIKPFLAPEFQVVRSNGRGYDKAQYLASGLPRIESKPAYNDLVVTRNGDIVVTRMRLAVSQVLDGKKAISNSPQLIVFRAAPDGWQVIAAANFAKLEN